VSACVRLAEARAFVHVDVDHEAAEYSIVRTRRRCWVELDGRRSRVDPETARRLVEDDQVSPLTIEEIRRRVEACQ
jgi:hypothetical protein